MKKIHYLVAFTVMLFCMRVSAQAPSSLLYEVVDPNSGQKSYVFGTMHDSRRSIFNFNDSVFYAINQTHKAVFELALDDLEESNPIREIQSQEQFSAKALELMNVMMTDVIDSIMLYYTPGELADKLDEIVSYMVKPVQSVIKQMQSNENQFYIDKFYMNYAKNSGKEIGALETFDQQIRALTKDLLEINIKESNIGGYMIKLLRDPSILMDFTDLISMNNKLADHYAQADLNAICDLITEVRLQSKDNLLSERFYQSMFEDRNVLMAEKAIALSRKQPVFIAVGAGHLCGQTGLIEAFKKAGYRVRPVNISAPVPMAIQWTSYEAPAYSFSLPSSVSSNDLEVNSHKSGWSALGNFYINEMSLLGNKPTEPAYMYTPKGVVAFAIAKESNLFDDMDDARFYDTGVYTDDLEVIPPQPPPPSPSVPSQETWVEEPKESELYPFDYDSVEVEDPDNADLVPSMNNVMELMMSQPERMIFIEEFSDAVNWSELTNRFYGLLLLNNLSFDETHSLTLPQNYGEMASNSNAPKLEFALSKSGSQHVVYTVIENQEGEAYRLYIYGDYEAITDPSLLPFFYQFEIK